MVPVLRLAVAGVRRRGLGQVLVLVLVTALASAAVVAGLAGQRSTATLVDDAYERAGRPDLVLRGTADALRAVAADPDVAAASAPVRVGRAETLVGDQRVDVALIAVDPADGDSVGVPRLAEGRWPATDDEVVVERSLVTEAVVDVGGDLVVRDSGSERVLRVVGSAVELSDCFWPTCDPLRVFGSDALVQAAAADDGGPVFLARYRLVDPAMATDVGTRLLRERGQDGVFAQNTWPDTRGDILIVGEVFGAMVSGFGAFLLAAACFVVAGATAARLVARRRSLGLLRAIGFTPRQLTLAVLVEHAVLGAVGVVAGWVLGSLVAPGLSTVDAVLDTSATTFHVRGLVVALLVVEVFLAVAVVLPAWRVGRQPATEVVRDVPTAPTGGRAVAGALRRLGAGPSTVAGIRRALARPLRATLAAGAVLVAAVGAVVAAGFITTVQGAVADPARTGNPWDIYAFPTGGSGDDVATALEGTDGVTAWYTERESTAVLGRGSYLVRILGGDAQAAAYRIREGRAPSAPGEAIVGYGLLDDAGLDVGDRTALEIGGTPLDVTIVGWYSETADGGKVVIIHERTLGEGESDAPRTYRGVTQDGADREAVAADVQAALGDRGVAVAPDFGDGGIGAIVGTLVGFAALLGLVAVANLVATTLAATRERAHALGILRTIGCTTAQLVGQSAVGAGILGLGAAVVGVPAGAVVFRALADAITSGAGIGPGMATSPPVWFLAALVPGLVAMAAASGALAAVGLSRRPAAELVRYE